MEQLACFILKTVTTKPHTNKQANKKNHQKNPEIFSRGALKNKFPFDLSLTSGKAFNHYQSVSSDNLRCDNQMQAQL